MLNIFYLQQYRTVHTSFSNSFHVFFVGTFYWNLSPLLFPHVSERGNERISFYFFEAVNSNSRIRRLLLFSASNQLKQASDEDFSLQCRQYFFIRYLFLQYLRFPSWETTFITRKKPEKRRPALIFFFVPPPLPCHANCLWTRERTVFWGVGRTMKSRAHSLTGLSQKTILRKEKYIAPSACLYYYFCFQLRHGLIQYFFSIAGKTPARGILSRQSFCRKWKQDK